VLATPYALGIMDILEVYQNELLIGGVSALTVLAFVGLLWRRRR